ncbi:hypothetical protein FZC35_00915 [Candidatus Cytomitobacter indipagum]|uniref:Uncharacterized protein n=1 Tax=Candidatus Cytomitobacter indipagum TaxID=2601575 RepID=A0A5C0UFA6_9PROT|nr:hypothetical protein [Candidatus Cytomitobacter indipagum]QEK37942.1 hypothetical protein FZC35_00915 [Candidatus Cytomitobacter indipagum]
MNKSSAILGMLLSLFFNSVNADKAGIEALSNYARDSRGKVSNIEAFILDVESGLELVKENGDVFGISKENIKKYFELKSINGVRVYTFKKERNKQFTLYGLLAELTKSESKYSQVSFAAAADTCNKIKFGPSLGSFESFEINITEADMEYFAELSSENRKEDLEVLKAIAEEAEEGTLAHFIKLSIEGEENLTSYSFAFENFKCKANDILEEVKNVSNESLKAEALKILESVNYLGEDSEEDLRIKTEEAKDKLSDSKTSEEITNNEKIFIELIKIGQAQEAVSKIKGLFEEFNYNNLDNFIKKLVDLYKSWILNEAIKSAHDMIDVNRKRFNAELYDSKKLRERVEQFLEESKAIIEAEESAEEHEEVEEEHEEVCIEHLVSALTLSANEAYTRVGETHIAAISRADEALLRADEAYTAADEVYTAAISRADEVYEKTDIVELEALVKASEVQEAAYAKAHEAFVVARNVSEIIECLRNSNDGLKELLETNSDFCKLLNPYIEKAIGNNAYSFKINSSSKK